MVYLGVPLAKDLMRTPYTPGLFITGTDTGVGKTHVAAVIARKLVAEGLRVGVYKPVASGCSRDAEGKLTSDDARVLWEAAGRPGLFERVCPQNFAAPLAPHLAARAEGRELDTQLLLDGLKYWRLRSDVVLVEGAGGLFSPLDEGRLNIDFAREVRYPLVVVAPNRLGTIHGVLSTIIAARELTSSLPIKAVVLSETTNDKSDLSRASNADQIRQRIKMRDIGQIAELAYGIGAFNPPIDW